jgi:TonB family protein
MQLERSSGSSTLDEAARSMIEQAAPFPPLPSYYPREGVVIVSTIPVFPVGR